MKDAQVIRGNSVLPARRTPITLHTADGLDLVGELALPLEREPVATMVCLHPLPTHGGMMDSHLFRKASYRLPALADLAVLRFNTRGTTSVQGTSGGSFDEAQGERYDVAAAIELADFEDLPDIWLVGWSFGTDLALKYGLDAEVITVMGSGIGSKALISGNLDVIPIATPTVIAMALAFFDLGSIASLRNEVRRAIRPDIPGPAQSAWRGDEETEG